MGKPLLNKYVFDYALVLKEDPTFEKFIEYEQEEGRIDIGCGTPFDQEEQIPTESSLYQEVIENLRAQVGTTGTAEKENVEENEIINFVHDKDGNQGQDWELMEGELQHTRREPTTSPTPQPTVRLKPEYEDPPNPNYDPSILQLLPPNRFLKEGSKVWLGDNTLYEFSTYDTERPDHISLITKHSFSHYHPFIRLIVAYYWFDRSKNAMSELKSRLKMWIYNTKTKQIYLIKKTRKNEKKGSHFHNNVKKVFNVLLNTDWNSGGSSSRLNDKFLNTITQTVIKDIGEAALFALDDIAYEKDAALEEKRDGDRTIKIKISIDRKLHKYEMQRKN